MKFSFFSIISLFICFNTMAQQTKIGFVYEDYILANLPQTKKVQDEVNVRKQEFETQLKAKAEKYQEKYLAYQAAIKDISTSTSESLNALVKDVQELKKDLEDSQAKAEEELRTMANEKFLVVQELIEKTEKIVAKEQGFMYVIRANVDYESNETRPFLLYSVNGAKDNLSNAIIIKLGGTPPPPKSNN